MLCHVCRALRSVVFHCCVTSCLVLKPTRCGGKTPAELGCVVGDSTFELNYTESAFRMQCLANSFWKGFAESKSDVYTGFTKLLEGEKMNPSQAHDWES